jgi:hypothetical protein
LTETTMRTNDDSWRVVLVDAPADAVEKALDEAMTPTERKKLFVDRIRDPADTSLGLRRGIEHQDAKISAVQLVDGAADDGGASRRLLVAALSALRHHLGGDRVFAPRGLADPDDL